MKKEFGVKPSGNIACQCAFVKDMRNLCGRTASISDISRDGIVLLDGWSDTTGKIMWSFSTDMIEHAPPELSIHITSDGKTTHAVLKDGGKVTRRAKAVCSPDDEFDFATGARIAFDRLTGTETAGTIREVKRPAKVGEYIKVLTSDGHPYSVGTIGVVSGLGGPMRTWVTINGNLGGYIREDQYVVLEGYTPPKEPDKPAFRPHLDCDGENYGYIGEPTEYKDAVGRSLAVGDEVELYKGGVTKGRRAIVFSSIAWGPKNHKAFVMGIESNCDGNGGIGGGWSVIKARSHSEISHGEVVGVIRYVKEPR